MISQMCLVDGIKVGFLHRRAGLVGALLIHGNSSCKEVFERQFTELAKTGLSIVVPDLPGHGSSDNSTRPSNTYSFPGYAETLTKLMQRLGYSSYCVVGWSLGGHIGLEMFANDRSVRSLLISGTPPIPLTIQGATEGFRWSSATLLAGRKHLSDSDVRRYVWAMMGRPLGSSHHFSRMIKRTDGNARQWMVRNGLSGRGVNQANTALEADRPIAIIQGDSDPFIRIDYLKAIRGRSIWNNGPVLIRAGHAAHWEAPQQFNEAMINFLLQTQ